MCGNVSPPPPPGPPPVTPRELVSEPSDRSVAQDTFRPDLWRVNLCRNCQVTNPHMPLVAFGIQSNSDSTPVATRHQAAMYCCKYCSKFTKGKGTKCAIYEIMDDMDRRDTIAQERHPNTYEASKLGGKLHKAFMAQIGSEMCQAEVAHYANRMPEYLLSRDVKHVHLYKKTTGDPHEELQHSTTSKFRSRRLVRRW